jgi:hypothetical protein
VVTNSSLFRAFSCPEDLFAETVQDATNALVDVSYDEQAKKDGKSDK